MAFGHGLAADFTLATVSIKAYISEIDPSFEREMAEYAHLGDEWKSNMSGLRMGSVSITGDFDPTLDAAVWTAFDGETAVAWEYFPQGDTATKVVYSGNCRISSYKPGPASTSDMVKASFDMVCDGDVTRDTVSA